MKIGKLAVFCGSRRGNNDRYADDAAALGRLVARYKVELIYGGGKNGLMGIIADTVMENGGIVRGIIPQLLLNWESQHKNISELLVVDDMHVRKRKLYELCDAAIILPGGFGTLDELFEMLTWNQLSIHDKKIFLLNSGGFYDHLIAHMKVLSTDGFLYGALEEKITILNAPEEMVPFIS
jgi:uncharacterized protein (TIGR00730 family)